jgi:putative addiction module CopG family antidote
VAVAVSVILSGRPPTPYDNAMDNVTLPPELERFAAEAVAAGRYRDVADVVAAGVSLLQRQEAARAEFVASLEAAEAESDREGWHTIDDVHAEMAALIDEARRAKV